MPMEWQTLYYKPHFWDQSKEQKVKIYIYRSVDRAGTRVPPALISGKLVSEINKQFSEQ
jgi:hypothetical protein